MSSKYSLSALRLLPLLAVLLPVACVEVELCEEAEHPHRGHVTFTYQWENGDTPPDSMLIASVRILNLWKCGIIYNPATDSGRYVFNAPETIPVWADPETYHPTPPPPPPSGFNDVVMGDPDPAPAPEETYVEPQYEHFALREGTYKFFTLNKDAKEVNIEDAYTYMAADNDEMQLTDIYLRYATYKWDNDSLRKLTDTWEDYNPGFDYIQTNAAPVYYDSVNFSNIYLGEQENRITFNPKRITQNIDINVEFEKAGVDTIPFTVDSVFAEISGIPLRMALTTGYIDMTRTARMLFRCDVADTRTAAKVTAHANIDVTTIVPPRSANEVGGPGILLLIVHTTAYDEDGVRHPKALPAIINLYDPLMKAKLTTLTDDGLHAYRSMQHAVLNIRQRLDGDVILNHSDDTGGMEGWVDGGEQPGPPDNPYEI